MLRWIMVLEEAPRNDGENHEIFALLMGTGLPGFCQVFSDGGLLPLYNNFDLYNAIAGEEIDL